MSIFKACDIRGIPGEEITSALFIRIGRGIALMMGERRSIVVGGDLRVSTGALKAALIRGLCEGGRTVTDLGVTPTPAIYFAKSRFGARACAIVTASHNPPEYNGLKFMIGDLPVLPEDVERLRRLVEGSETDVAAAEPATVISSPGVLSAYEEWVLETGLNFSPGASPEARRLTVVVDAGNGTYSEIGPRVIQKMPGITVNRLFCLPDGYFPGRDPNCAVPENLVDLCHRVQEVGADIGVAFDGDGDRVAFVDDRGEVVSADEMTVLFLRCLGERLQGEKFVYDHKCSHVVAREAKNLGAVPVMEKSGHAFIKRRMITEEALFGSEVSGHYFYRELNGCDDGLFSAIFAIRLLQGRGRSLGEFRRTVPPRFITDDIRLPCAPDDAEKLIERVRAAFPEDRRIDLDGIRVLFPRGWGLLRASITEPKITLRFEGEDAASLREVMDAFLTPLPELRARVETAMSNAKCKVQK